MYELIGRFECFDQDCVPWSVPDIGIAQTRRGPKRMAKKNPKLTSWQTIINARARTGWRRWSGPHLGPVALYLTFHFPTTDRDLFGTAYFPAIIVPKPLSRSGHSITGDQPPDLTNLVKAAEDAIKGVWFVDDSQVVEQHNWRYYGARAGVTGEVYSVKMDPIEEMYNHDHERHPIASHEPLGPP